MTPSEQITAAVAGWPGVTTPGTGERGEFPFMLGRHEIGHLHGDHAAHFAFGMKLGAQLREQGQVVAHPVTDKPTLGARRIGTAADVDAVIELMRLNYDRLVERYGLPRPIAA